MLRFAEKVENSKLVGAAFALSATKEAELEIIPSLIDSENSSRANFISSYVWKKEKLLGLDCVNTIDFSKWKKEKIGAFLSYLPFSMSTWHLSSLLLDPVNENEYWKRTYANPYESDGNLDVPIKKLTENQRHWEAINCIHKQVLDKTSIDPELAVEVLLRALSSEDFVSGHRRHETRSVIKALQDLENVDPAKMFQIEWAYLPLLDGYQGFFPKFLQKKLRDDPHFYCEVIRTIYRGSNDDEQEKIPTEQEQAIATNSLHLLFEWKSPPGFDESGTFSGKILNKWAKQVREICEETGHLNPALIHMGHVLHYCPPDENGLWIDSSAAKLINRKDGEKIRSGFSTEAFNSRGVHSVDPGGKGERELAQAYFEKAEALENEGFQQFANTVRLIGDHYLLDEKRVISEFQDRLEN